MSVSTIRTKYLIIGAGLSGLSAAHHLKENYLLMEANNFVGGNASTLFHKGFKLDNSVHVLYFRSNTILDWIRDTIQVELLERNRESTVWVENSYVRFPIQYHLSELPFNTKQKSIRSILLTLFLSSGKKSTNFEAYSQKAFGKYLADIFIRPYNEKLFGVPLVQLNTDWLGDYVPAYSRIKMLLSALNSSGSVVGRNSKYYYPAEGGIAVLAQKISSQLYRSPDYNTRLEKIFVDEKKAIFNDGIEVNYEILINTIPLDTFVNKFHSIPNDVSNSLKSLKKQPTTILHILGKGKINNEAHWIYIPNQTIPFYRVTIPGNINPLNCPDGYFALTLEFGGDVFENQLVLEKSISALKAMSLLNEKNTNIEFRWKLLDYGYVIYDQYRETALIRIFSFLKSNRIFSIGRYGSWEYSNMEDAILHGKNVASYLLNTETTVL